MMPAETDCQIAASDVLAWLGLKAGACAWLMRA